MSKKALVKDCAAFGFNCERCERERKERNIKIKWVIAIFIIICMLVSGICLAWQMGGYK